MMEKEGEKWVEDAEILLRLIENYVYLPQQV